MATNTERIELLGANVTNLSKQVALIELQVKSLTEQFPIVERLIPVHDKRMALLERDHERLEKRFDELTARRWDVRKLILAAISRYLDFY